MVRNVSKDRLFIEELELPTCADAPKQATTCMKGEECSLPPIICEAYLDLLGKLDSHL